uniref:Beta-glucuronidase n=1 Tax=Glossina pallidipes TaxID=7398 RepID=A0A1B0A7B7_GLOPL
MVFIGYCIFYALALVLLNRDIVTTTGMLYPRESETREVRSLDGLWNFVKSDITNPTQGMRDKWYLDDLSRVRKTIPMPVPASYNDITTEHAIRDHVGTVWYDRKFFVPMSWSKNQRVWLRFGSVHYEAFVYVNGEMVVRHEMGHLPFEAEISQYVKYGQENRITVMCDNALIQTTIPQGKITELARDDGVSIVQTYTFDFFNYAGIHRSVHLYTTPSTYIEEIDFTTDLSKNNTVGFVKLAKVKIGGSVDNEAASSDLHIRVQLLNKEGIIVANTTSKSDMTAILEIKNVKPWWPYLMHHEPGYLYEMEIFLIDSKTDEIQDVYRCKVGVRTLSWNNSSFMINGKPIYFRGFGRHEDSDIRGKGLDLALMTRDFNLLKWVGANAYRTSHYPYSEESMQFADENGIMIIDECPSVDTDNPGRLDMITKRIIDEATTWHEKHNKPVIISEYGADTVEGLHLLPSYVWSEEYQTELFSRHFRAFDILRKKSWFIGEFVWNFADFKTAQSVTRVGGNKKGVFTRSRQPKAVAHLLRKRYFALGREVDQCTLIPTDLFTYITDGSSTRSSKHDSTDL